MTTTPTCALRGCDRPSPAGPVCSSCWDRIRADLAELPDLVAQLELTLSRQVRIGDPGPRSGTTSPLPFDLRASRISVQVRNELVGLVRLVHDERQLRHGPVCGNACRHGSCSAIRSELEDWPQDTLAAMARWLHARQVELRRHPALVEIAETILRVRRRVAHAIDRPPDGVYVGQCGARVETPANHRGAACETDLYAEPDATTVRCPNRECRTVWDVEVRRQVLLEAAQDVLAHAELIGRALPILGEEVTPNVIQGYARRGRIVARGHDEAGRALYRVGDVLDVVRENARRRKEAEQRKATRRAGSLTTSSATGAM